MSETIPERSDKVENPAVEAVGIEDVAGKTFEKLEITGQDAPKIEQALNGKKIDKDTIKTLTRDELFAAEKKESGTLSVLFAQTELGERYTDTNLKKFAVGQKMKIDFKGNKEAYWKIGLGAMLPAYVRGVQVTKTNKDGSKEVVKSGMRARTDGGFYDTNGNYMPIFTGDEVEITSVEDDVFKKWQENREGQLAEQKKFFEETRAKNPDYKVKIEDLPVELQIKEKERIDGKLNAKTLGGILEKFGPALVEECKLQGVPEEMIPLIVSLGKSESGWNPNAKNPNSTATGIGQFIKSTALSMQKALIAEGRDLPRDPEEFLARMRQDARLQVTMLVRLVKDSCRRLKATAPEIDPLKNPNQVNLAFLAIAHHDGAAGAKMYIRWWKDSGMPEHIPMFPDEETAKRYAVASFQRNRSLGGPEGSNGVVRYATNIARRASGYESEVASYVKDAKQKLESTPTAVA